MALADIAPTKEDFDRSGWQDVITDNSAKDIGDYASLLSKKLMRRRAKAIVILKLCSSFCIMSAH